MRICIGGKNNIAVDVCGYILEKYPQIPLYAIPNRNDGGVDNFQRSFRRFVEEQKIPLVSLKEIARWYDLVFLSLEFDRIIRTEEFASKELFNLHFSLLPKYRGCHTVVYPILNGDNEGGVTLHKIDSGIDTGDIIDSEKLLIEKNETSLSLYLKYIDLGANVVKRNIAILLNGKYTAFPQKKEDSSYHSRSEIDYAHLSIDFNATAVQVNRQVRAFSFREYQMPKFQGIPLSSVEITSDKSLAAPGTLMESGIDYLKVATADYDVLLYRDR